MIWRDASTTMAWRALQKHARANERAAISWLFSQDAERPKWTVAEGAGLTLDFSRQRVDGEAFGLLCRLADEIGLRDRTEAMYRGEILNPSEKREVLHTALRRANAPHAGEVREVRERMLDFAEGIRGGSIRGSQGDAFNLVVNIGIGGSDLGPAMAVQALHEFAAGSPRAAFVSNVDGCRLADTLATADPARTLFIVCSKTFTTLETITNAKSARAWLSEHLGDDAVPDHFAAVSTNAAEMDAFGVHPDYRFAMWDWVGGRYSLWSAIGVSVAVAIGRRHFEALLAGAAAMDQHFVTADWRVNVPALMGLLGVWNINLLGLPTLAVLPYDDRLARFPAYLQQLDMESNGKSVRLTGAPVFCETSPVVWGEPGNNAQHSFFQMLHQGTPRAALDFLLPALSSCGDQAAQDLAIANCLAQAEAFAYGQPAAKVGGDPELVAHKVHAGNRPSSLVLFRKTDPATLGALIAMYEHKIFTQSVVWGINAFDQWGVELGKKLAQGIAPLVRGEGEAGTASLRRSLELLNGLKA